MTATFSLMAARELSRRVLQAAGVAAANADSVMRAVVAAEVDGLAEHGLASLPALVAGLKAGRIDGLAVPALVDAASGAVTVDGRNGFAAPALRAGLARAIERIETAGTVVLAVGNAHAFGDVGHHIESVAERGLVALAFGNAPAMVIFASPSPDGAPLVFDLHPDAQDAAMGLMIDLLDAAMRDAPPRHPSQSVLVLDPARFAGAGFPARVSHLMAAIPAQDEVHLPGRGRLAARARARDHGLSIPDNLHADLVRLAGGD